jgi:hypothetical protein
MTAPLFSIERPDYRRKSGERPIFAANVGGDVTPSRVTLNTGDLFA